MMRVLKWIFALALKQYKKLVSPDAQEKTEFNDISGIFSRASKKKYPSQKTARKKEFADPICPYCQFRLAKFPVRRQKCPECKELMYRIRDWSTPVTKYWLATKEEAEQREQAERDAYIEREKEKAKESVQLTIALLNNMYNPEIGVNHVKICNSPNGPCDCCKTLNGRIITIEQALRTMPIPNTECTHGFCCCFYEVVFDDEI
jgi:hypothetical protein